MIHCITHALILPDYRGRSAAPQEVRPIRSRASRYFNIFKYGLAFALLFVAKFVRGYFRSAIHSLAYSGGSGDENKIAHDKILALGPSSTFVPHNHLKLISTSDG